MAALIGDPAPFTAMAAAEAAKTVVGTSAVKCDAGAKLEFDTAEAAEAAAWAAAWAL
jgi:hypothetical protein